MTDLQERMYNKIDIPGAIKCTERELNLLSIIEELQAQLSDYEEVNKDKKRLARELDVAMHGEENAAPQASLCDLIGPAIKMREELSAKDAVIEGLRKDKEDMYKKIDAQAQELYNIKGL